MVHPSEGSAARFAALITLLILAALFWGAIAQLQPPAPVPASAPAGQFSA